MSIYEYDEEKTMRQMREESFENGYASGKEDGYASGKKTGEMRINKLNQKLEGAPMDEVIKSPEYEKLESEVREKHQELSDILFVHDDLKYVIRENIKTKYLSEVGGLEYEVFEKFCEFLRLRRKKELIQAKINRRVLLCKLIELQIDFSLKVYKLN